MANDYSVDYSIVIPVFCNQGTLSKIYRIIKNSIIDRNRPKSCEIIFVDDGSYDTSLEELLSLKKEDPDTVKIIKFTRNFGQVPAIMAGYEHAKGKYVINISADLQDPPELINEMLNASYQENYDIVAGVRQSRDESLFRVFTSNIFYWLMKKLAFRNMPLGGFDFILISDKVKRIILEEANPFLQGQILWTGYKIKFLPYDRKKREVGGSKWTFSKKITYLIDGVMGYSYLPLRMMSLLGVVVAFLGFLYAIAVLIARIVGNIQTKGWAPLMIVILVLSGIQMLMLGVIGEYLWRTLNQVRHRQNYIIEKIY